MNSKKEDLFKKIELLLQQSQWRMAGEMCAGEKLDHVVFSVSSLSEQRKIQLFKALESNLQESVFRKLPNDDKLLLLSTLEIKSAKRLLVRLSIDSQKELFQLVPEGRKKALFSNESK